MIYMDDTRSFLVEEQDLLLVEEEDVLLVEEEDLLLVQEDSLLPDQTFGQRSSSPGRRRSSASR